MKHFIAALILMTTVAANAATFTVAVTDAGQLAGITAARVAYNAAQPDVRDAQGNVTGKANQLATDADYVQFIFGKAAESYQKQYNTK